MSALSQSDFDADLVDSIVEQAIPELVRQMGLSQPNENDSDEVPDLESEPSPQASPRASPELEPEFTPAISHVLAVTAVAPSQSYQPERKVQDRHKSKDRPAPIRAKRRLAPSPPDVPHNPKIRPNVDGRDHCGRLAVNRLVSGVYGALMAVRCSNRGLLGISLSHLSESECNKFERALKQSQTGIRMRRELSHRLADCCWVDITVHLSFFDIAPIDTLDLTRYLSVVVS